MVDQTSAVAVMLATYQGSNGTKHILAPTHPLHRANIRHRIRPVPIWNTAG